MRKVIGIGETLLDIIFQQNRPLAAVPGGSVFNASVSLARMGVPVDFIGETGHDHVGRLIRQFMHDNGMNTSHMNEYEGNKSPVSLAFLNDRRDAQYSFYRDYPQQRLTLPLPEIEADDVVIIGSFYAVAPALRAKHRELLAKAKEKKAIVFYDLNLRQPHKSEVAALSTSIAENIRYADVVRGSKEDCLCAYDLEDPDEVYRQEITPHCRNFIYTAGAEGVVLRSNLTKKSYPATPLTPVSTVGAGDNFNAGLIYGLIRTGIRHDDLPHLTDAQWDEVMRHAIRFASEVCLSTENSISAKFASNYR